MQLLSALSSTTSSLAMQAMPLVAPATGDFAALMADMVPAGDAGAIMVPAQRQAAAPAGNGLPVAIAAPVAVVEAPVVTAPDAVSAIPPPLPVSATEAVLMLPVEADAPAAAPVAAPVAAVAVAMGVLANIVPDEEKAETPTRTEDVAVRALPMPVPTRFAAPMPRVKRTEPTPRDDAPVAREDKADEPDPLVQDDAVPTASPVTPQPAQAIVLPAADPVAAAESDAMPAPSLVIEQGEVVAAEPMTSTASPMRMAKRRADPIPAQAPAAEQTTAPVRPTEPAVGVVTPLNTDRVVPVHVVVPPAATDAAPVPAQPVASRISGETGSPNVTPVAVDQPMVREPSIGLADSGARPAIAIDSIRQRDVARSARPRASAPPIVPMSAAVAVPPAVIESVAPPVEVVDFADPNAPIAATALPTSERRAAPATFPDTPDIRPAERQDPVEVRTPVAAGSVAPVIVPASPGTTDTGSVAPIAGREPVFADRAPITGDTATPIAPAAVQQPADAAAPVAANTTLADRVAPFAQHDSAVADRAPIIPVAAPAVVAGASNMDRAAPAPRREAIVADRAPMTGEAAALVVPVAVPAVQSAAATPIASGPLRDVAPAVVAGASNQDRAAPAPRREAIVADRAPMTGEAAALVVPAAVSAVQSAAATPMASGPLPDVTPAVVTGASSKDRAAPVARREAIIADRAPMTGEAAAPVVPVAAPMAQPATAAAPVTRIASVPLSDSAPTLETAVERPPVRHAMDAATATPATPPVTRLAAAPVPDAVPVVDAAPVDTDTPSPRPHRDEDLSVPTTGGAQATDAAVLRPVAPTAQAAQPTLDTRQPQWVEGMIDRIATLRESSATNGSGEIRIRLSPDALGDVEVAIRTGDDGKLHVHIASENADAGRLLAEAQPRLVQMAEARGLKLGGMQVDVGSQQPQQSQRQAQEQGHAAPRAPRSASTNTTTQTTRSTDRIA